jgi:formamidopyrimidine-DNA glycosylase
VPELPEVETARALIAARALDRPITGVDDSDVYVTRPHFPGELSGALAGRRLTAARRRGKTMWLETSGAGQDPGPGPELGIHLGMSGRILITAPDGGTAEGGDYDTRPPSLAWSRFALTFADGSRLALIDPRRLGRVWLHPDLAALGPDAATVTPAQFRALVTAGTTAVKARLLDQSKIAGIGNLLADEILWQARVPPQAPAGSLTPAQVRRLYQALTRVLAAAMSGAGAHDGEVIAERRAGGTCPRDGAPMAHGTVGGRSTWWCSREQALRPPRRSGGSGRRARDAAEDGPGGQPGTAGVVEVEQAAD